MSRHFFIPNSPAIILEAVVSVQQTARALLALDTGASRCQISNRIAASIGLDMSSPIREIEIVTGSGVVQAPVLYLPSLVVLGKEVSQLEVVVHDLPPRARLDGLLGLNFFRDYNLFLNYGKGILVIQDRAPKNFWLNFTQAIEVWCAMR
jgi:predicted aspartyl protease